MTGTAIGKRGRRALQVGASRADSITGRPDRRLMQSQDLLSFVFHQGAILALRGGLLSDGRGSESEENRG